jgi:hypothetical protein
LIFILFIYFSNIRKSTVLCSQFFVAKFCQFARNILKKEYSIKILCSFESNLPKYQKSSKNLPKITTIANDLKQLLQIFDFHIFNITKFG